MDTKRARMFGINGVFFLCIISCSFQGCKKEPSRTTGEETLLSTGTTKGHKELGLSLYENGKNREAIEEFKKALADNPGDAEVCFELASAYSDEEMIDDAITMYKRVIELEPNHIEAHYNLGFILLDKGSCAEGIEELKKVLEIDPKYEDISYSLADAYYDCKKVDDAIVIWESLLKEDPDDKVLHYNLGVAYRDKGQLERALTEAEKALAGDVKDADARKLFRQLTQKRGKKSSGKSKKTTEKKEK
ncbi:MAG: hypothetical protein CV087_00205 [Candidatus Brocadia sp. WS118]|nr:MAG: hypothetical protein CV087_00205 [Candidatus Brocadia sp. WS118]